jgi:hypothetical protein
LIDSVALKQDFLLAFAKDLRVILHGKVDGRKLFFEIKNAVQKSKFEFSNPFKSRY